MNAAIIVAAGRGTRMGTGGDKLFLPLAGRPVIAHTWRGFEASPVIDEIVLVIRAGQEAAFRELANRLGFQKRYRLTPGGVERQDSVWNGLEALDPEVEFVAIHDGARPCLPPGLIEATFRAAEESGAAVAAQPVTDTVKESNDGITIARHLDRSRLWSVQTPQTFRLEIIRRALQAVREQGRVVTDDTAACELIGQAVRLVACEGPNPKITRPSDIPFVELLLNQGTEG